MPRVEPDHGVYVTLPVVEVRRDAPGFYSLIIPQGPLPQPYQLKVPKCVMPGQKLKWGIGECSVQIPEWLWERHVTEAKEIS